VLFYETPTRRVPVQDYLDGLPLKDQAVVARWLDRLERDGPNQPPDRVKHVVDKIWELRVASTQGEHRVLYYVHSNCATLLLAFLKKQNDTPANEIALAKKRLNDWQQRYNEWRMECPGS
jgi:phage-related protein